MRVTLDHNCVIDLLNGASTGSLIRSKIATGIHSFFVAEVGASEMRQRGVRPDKYDLFDRLLVDAGIADLPRLSPMGIWGVTFWDHSLWAAEQMSELGKQIERILFGDDQNPTDAAADLDSPIGRKWLNHTCDVLTMWCHIHYGNQIFLTSDKSFMKQSKLPALLSLGAGRVCEPSEL
jgi:hypothetical protein